ncbi:MAG: hypothetical protein HQL56_06840 [Magnetococcales bacterium]|nr:hypothetical protein [Magnetococcales bacterium]
MPTPQRNGLDPDQLVTYVIRPCLERLGLHSKAAEELILGTAIQESGLRFLHQIGGGPALGLWQMEPATHDDIWSNFLAFKPSLGGLILDAGHGTTFRHPDRLVSDLDYACAMARAHYFRQPMSLPAAGDLAGQAAYWKRYYNTPKGAGTVEEYIANWQRVMGGK